MGSEDAAARRRDRRRARRAAPLRRRAQGAEAPDQRAGLRPRQPLDEPDRRLSRRECGRSGVRIVRSVTCYIVAAGRRVPAARVGRLRPPARDLVRLLPRTRSRAACRPRPAQAFENGLRVIDFERRRARALRADAPAVVDAAALARGDRLLDVLELAVHRRRARAALGLPPPQRAFLRFRNTILLANVHRARRLRAAADGAAAAVPGRRLRRHARDSRASTTAAGSSSSPRTPTPRCRACTPRTRSSSASCSRCVWKRWLGEGALDRLAGWVWFTVMATGNHFWLDVAAGLVVALISVAIVYRLADPPPLAADSGVARQPLRSAVRRAASGRRVKQRLHGRARAALAARSMAGLARTRVTPNALTAAGVALCAVAAVLVYFEYRNELLFFWLGAVVFVDRLDPRHPRRRARPRRRQGDAVRRVPRLDDSTGSARASCSARSRSSSRARATTVALAFASPRSPARSSSATRGPRPRRSASRATSASAAAPSASS